MVTVSLYIADGPNIVSIYRLICKAVNAPTNFSWLNHLLRHLPGHKKDDILIFI